MTFRRDMHDQRTHADTMELLRQLYGVGGPLEDVARRYAQEAMNDANQQAAPDDVEDCTDDGA